MIECGICHALVYEHGVERHMNWHKAVAEQTAKVEREITRLFPPPHASTYEVSEAVHAQRRPC